MKSELHVIIIWESIKNKADFIIKDFQKQFDIRQIYEIEWKKENFENNLKRFYGQTLPDPNKKANLCGYGSFLVVLFYDHHPKHGKRGTSIGKQFVNTNVYDKKRQLRKILGGSFPIHGSIHENETNHDCTLLLSKNINDLKKTIPEKWDQKTTQYKNDLVGTNGWKNTDEFFYVLNSLFNYVVLRNFESYPEEITSSEHKDIDLLTDDLLQIPYVINRIIPKINDNFKSTYVIIKGKKVHVDLIHIKDGYYDEKWCKNILKNRVFNKNGFFIPNLNDYFHSLLYHGLIHKRQISEDYIIRLIKISKELKIKTIEKKDFTNNNVKNMLDSFLKNEKYQYTNSRKYKIKNNEMSRLLNVAKYTIKNDGLDTLMRAVKKKIKQKLLGKNKKY